MPAVILVLATPDVHRNWDALFALINEGVAEHNFKSLIIEWEGRVSGWGPLRPGPRGLVHVVTGSGPG